jgi:Domain of unknown function (DUF4190)
MMPANNTTKIPMGDTVDSSGPQSVYREKQTCGYAIASMICGIVSLIAFNIIILGPVAIILGPVAIVWGRNSIERIDANPYELEGKPLAQAGVIFGIIATVMWIIYIIFFAVTEF